MQSLLLLEYVRFPAAGSAAGTTAMGRPALRARRCRRAGMLCTAVGRPSTSHRASWLPVPRTQSGQERSSVKGGFGEANGLFSNHSRRLGRRASCGS